MTTQTQNSGWTDRLAKALDFSSPATQLPAPSQSAPVASPTPAVPLPDSVSFSPEMKEPAIPHPAFLGALSANWAGNSSEASSQIAGVPAPAKPLSSPALSLPSGYRSLELLGSELSQRDPRFSDDSANGRSAKALALAIGGTEVYGKGSTGTDFFTRRGGTGNNMRGFGQFNLDYHRQATSNPQKYTRFMGNILTGKAPMPNGRGGSNHAEALSRAVEAGQIKDGKDFRKFMLKRGFGGSNWQGIDDGWGRTPGLADGLVRFLRAKP